jgi:putative DNA primase/helicase
MKLANGKWPSILTSMGMDETVVSGKHGPSPMCGGKDRFRLISKEGPARWICNQCGSGDGMDLLMAFRNCNFKEAANDIRPIVGGCTYSEKPQALDKVERRRRLKNNVEMWKAAVPDHPLLKEYLKSRGLNDQLIAGADIRLHPELPYYDDDGKRKGEMPAMLTRISTRDNKLAAIHRTYLHKRVDKFEFVTKKKITTTSRDWKGGAIKLMSIKDKRHLIICEGVETALSLRALIWLKHGVQVPCWATVSANAMERIAIPDSITNVMIGADNDDSFTGQKAAFTLANRLRVHDKRQVTVVTPVTRGNDFNDELMEWNKNG